jgi:hypothetical protein
MSKKFLNNMTRMLENSRRLSLKVLLEEKDDEDDNKEDPFADAFSDEEEEESSKEESSGESDEDESPLDDLEGIEGAPAEDVGDNVYDDLSALEKNVEDITAAKNIKTSVLNKFLFTPQDIVYDAPLTYSNESKSKLGFYVSLLKEDEDVESTLDQVEQSLEQEEERIEQLGDKSDLVTKKVLKGKNINVENEATDAASKFKHFDTLFSKAEIVANFYIKKIADLSAPQDLENNIKTFLEEFNSKLPEGEKIDIQLKPTSYNTAVGGKTAT